MSKHVYTPGSVVRRCELAAFLAVRRPKGMTVRTVAVAAEDIFATAMEIIEARRVLPHADPALDDLRWTITARLAPFGLEWEPSLFPTQAGTVRCPLDSEMPSVIVLY